MIPAVGQKFGPFEILGRLGGGGMGLVFRAWDSRLHREVAMKLLHNDYSMPGMRERFLREARAASALNHPNICTIFDIGERDGDPYLVMELLHGETLKERIMNRPIPTDELISVAKECAEALAAAHVKGIVHRDIKPANIFLVDKQKGFSQAKVLDFGLAKISNGRGSRASRALEITTQGATVGTLAYMSPEQARGEPLDSRSDLFSLGVVLYEMATRQIPFPGATSALVFVKLLNGQPDPVREWNGSIPRELDKIIHKLLAKDPSARFQTAMELYDALERAGEKNPGGGWLRKAITGGPTPPRPMDKMDRTTPRPFTTERRERRERNAAESGYTGVERRRTERPSSGYGDEPRGVASSGYGQGYGQGNTQESSSQMLRPVARVPKEDVFSSLQAQGREPSESRSITPVPVNPPSSDSSRPAAPSGSAASARAARQSAQASLFPERDPVVRDPVVRDPGVRGTGMGLTADSREERAAGESSSRSPHVARPSSNPGMRVPARQPEAGDSGPQAVGMGPALAASKSRPSAPMPPAYDELLSGGEVERSSGWFWTIGVIALLGTIGLGALLAMRDRFRHVLLTDHDPVAFTTIENHTGDKNFDGSVAEAVELALAQSPYLLLHSSDDYRLALRLMGAEDAGSPATAREMAARLKAKAYLYGSISGEGSPYVIHLELLDTATGKTLAFADGTASSRERVTAAVDLMAYSLRSQIGEPANSIARSSVPLAREATKSLEALHHFAEGELLMQTGRLIESLAAYQKAIALDPKFTLPYLRMTMVYRIEHAELEAEQAARAGLAASADADEQTKLLAQYNYEMNAIFDYVRATSTIRQLLAMYPHSIDGLDALSRVQRLQGRLPEALQAAAQATTANPWNADSYFETELTLISLDRYDAALQVQGQLNRMGLTMSNGGLIAAYLAGRQDLLEQAAARLKGPHTVTRRFRDYGLYLDNTGQMAEGAALWREAEQQVRREPTLTSAASAYLVQGALDRALAGDCPSALAMNQSASAIPQSHTTIFNSGMASALCGDKAGAQKAIDMLEQRYPQSTAVNGYFIADLRGALALENGNPEQALEILKPARAFDLISLTPYLRGRAHVALRQIEVGIVDYQMVLSHRGITFTVGSNVYPMAQIGVARAFAASGDATNSDMAYQRFAELWKNGDKKQPLMLEALAGAKKVRERTRVSRGD